jgi:hypothetical protein
MVYLGKVVAGSATAALLENLNESLAFLRPQIGVS